MEIFITGATGVLGREVVPRLVAAGHGVRGMARSSANESDLRRLGAIPVRTDLLDPASLRDALAGSDAVFHLATSIPPPRRAGKAEAWCANDRLRREGTQALVDAALAAGVDVFVYPSVTFVYPDGGDRWLDAATTPPAAEPPTILRSTLDAEAAVARFAATGRRGIVLRMGQFYGPDASQMLALARRGFALVLGDGAGYQSSIWIPDAAAAVVAALERAPCGTYDVVDDEPLTRDELSAALAVAVGRRRLRHLPVSLMRRMAGAAAPVLVASQRVSNRRLKAATVWTPTVPSARDGWRRLGRTEPAESPAAPGPPRWVRAALALAGISALPVGLWQQLAPRSFYDDFPGFGRIWVAVDGPYNEHLLRDAGGGTLALAVVALAALVKPTRPLVAATGFALFVSQGPHALYHAAHLDLLPATLDRVLNMILLPLFAVIGALLLAWAARAPGTTTQRSAPILDPVGPPPPSDGEERLIPSAVGGGGYAMSSSQAEVGAG